MVLVENEPEPLLVDAFALYQLPHTPKWIGKAGT